MRIYLVCTCREISQMVLCIFFFQAEDGIRDVAVTGVQTCALPIYWFGAYPKIGDGKPWKGAFAGGYRCGHKVTKNEGVSAEIASRERDRKSTRLNSSHGYISYAVFCLKKKKKDHNSLHRDTPRKPHCT